MPHMIFQYTSQDIEIHHKVSKYTVGLHLRIGSTSEPLMCISFDLLKNNDPKIAKILWT